MTPGAIQLLLNAALLLIGFRAMGGRFGLATAYASLLMSGVTFVLERVYPMPAPFTSQPLLELIFAVMLPAFGSAILFNMNASTGGTDIVAMLLKKYTRMDIGRALLLTDVLVVVASAAVFGMETGLFSLLGPGHEVADGGQRHRKHQPVQVLHDHDGASPTRSAASSSTSSTAARRPTTARARSRTKSARSS